MFAFFFFVQYFTTISSTNALPGPVAALCNTVEADACGLESNFLFSSFVEFVWDCLLLHFIFVAFCDTFLERARVFRMFLLHIASCPKKNLPEALCAPSCSNAWREVKDKHGQAALPAVRVQSQCALTSHFAHYRMCIFFCSDHVWVGEGTMQLEA